ncbi:hypothetical protein QE444_000346 [Pseudomonas sp. SORGH_AS199]|uniref:DUF6311 domain-containing protein n=1 Tax=Pseudomonas sp. SORGH_AS_0199 TaxID=3041761 RepID=UPI00285C13CC|nr:DUF6311 domain-containing protein [Pseudomonas sp. SORGH_AS_0199]MDR6227989.1 hypothetical protein [Pseudomonas sp. SORGH_AS_0199]
MFSSNALEKLKAHSGGRGAGICSVLIGIVSFFVFTGGHILNPLYTSWLMAGDPAQHWLGWQFFSNTPLWQWPLGKNYPFGMEVSSSIVYTDSLPLLAIPLKLLTVVFPEVPQYTGFWIFLCFILQSVVSYKLLLRWTQDSIYALICCAFFSFAPVFIFRLVGHFALAGQWVILLALYFYFDRIFSILRWLLVSLLAVSIHAYLLAMVFAIYGAALLNAGLKQRQKWTVLLVSLLATAIAVAFAMWAIGYFVVKGGQAAGGFGIYRMDLAALWNPGFKEFSRFLRPNNGALDNLEGFNYLGLGMLLLCSYAAFSSVVGREVGGLLKRTAFEPLSWMLLGIFIYALSNTVSWAGTSVFEYSLPLWISSLTNTFRASGRFFWVAYYVIFLMAFLLAWKWAGKRARYIALCALVIQFYDVQVFQRFLVSHFAQENSYRKEFSGYPWDAAVMGKRNLIALYPDQMTSYWMQFGEFAAQHDLNMNFGWFARVDPAAKERQAELLRIKMEAHDFQKEDIYLLPAGQCGLWLGKAASGFHCQETKYAGVLFFDPGKD